MVTNCASDDAFIDSSYAMATDYLKQKYQYIFQQNNSAVLATNYTEMAIQKSAPCNIEAWQRFRYFQPASCY